MVDDGAGLDQSLLGILLLLLHRDYAGQAAAGTRGAEEGVGDCGSQRPHTAAVFGAPREFEGVMGGAPCCVSLASPLQHAD